MPPRVLSDLGHGGHALPSKAFDAVPNAERRADVSRLESVTAGEEVVGTPFGYLLTDLQRAFPEAHLPREGAAETVAALRALGSAMIDGDPGVGEGVNSTIRPVQTYFGQFIDHDITANTDRDTTLSITKGDATVGDFVPESPGGVLDRLTNLREPTLNLDSLYGDGPFAEETDTSVRYDGIEFRLGTLSDVPEGFGIPNQPIPDEDDRARDLFRNDQKAALVGDGRNDENLIVAQLHLAFLRFHNAVVRMLRDGDADRPEEETFAAAQRLVRQTYQWLVVNDFLTAITTDGTVDAVFDAPVYRPGPDGVFMPLEFSVAAFRFGHSMVRGVYDWNRNFPRATFDQLFQFTGRGDPDTSLAGAPTLPENWPAEWDRLLGTGEDPGGVHFARKIDTRLAPPLFAMINEGLDGAAPLTVRAILKSLAVRNLLRGYKLAIPTGQAVATELARKLDGPGGRVIGAPLSTDELLSGTNQALNAALADGGFLTATPLWFYVLKEAEVRGQGNALGPVGGRIVAETLVGLVVNDPDSYVNEHGREWVPTMPDGRKVTRIGDLVDVAGLLPGGMPPPEVDVPEQPPAPELAGAQA
jgi:hypothetical protein